MESLTRRMARWPAWQRWVLMLIVLSGLWGALMLSARTTSVTLRLLYLAVAVATMPLMIHVGRAVTCEGRDPMRREDRRYVREFTLGMVTYVLTMMFVWPLLRQVEPVWLKGVIAFTPAIPVALVILAMVRYVLGSDEFMQRMHLQALAVAAGVVGFASMAVGFLVAAEVLALDGSMLLYVYPALCVVYGVAFAWSKRRYRD
ncbi:hypothetical protein [Dyella subtropica]|uniref:hypothetical protein n=1 Tax=Dyella subtropica TaxID=2992127 RepID=UPI00224F0879|nr:hypothetical protein [Dyella subtropica]